MFYLGFSHFGVSLLGHKPGPVRPLGWVIYEFRYFGVFLILSSYSEFACWLRIRQIPCPTLVYQVLVPCF